MPLSLIIVVTMKEGAFVQLKLRALRSTILPSKQAQTGHAQTGVGHASLRSTVRSIFRKLFFLFLEIFFVVF